jgi:hypothetical protein
MFMPLPGAWKSISYNPDENKGYSLFFYNPVTNESQKEFPPPSQMPVQPSAYPRTWFAFNHDYTQKNPIEYTDEEYEKESLRLNEALPDFDEEPHDNDPEYSDDEEIEAFLRSQNHFQEPSHVPYHPDRVDTNYSRTHVLAEEARMRLKERGDRKVESEQSEQSGTESDEEENIMFGDFNRYELNYMSP